MKEFISSTKGKVIIFIVIVLGIGILGGISGLFT
jgi:hypothetical protein